MKRTSVLSICVLFVVLLTIRVAYSQSNAEYKMKIEKIDKEMVNYILAGDREKSLSLYTFDAISMPSYHPMAEGIEAIRKASEEMAKMGEKYNSFELTTLKVIANGNLITEIGTYKLSISIQGMDKPMEDKGKYLTMWEKQKDGSLKVKIEIWNSDIDPMSRMKQN
jgi:ketosteroid isomerase-like protein